LVPPRRGKAKICWGQEKKTDIGAVERNHRSETSENWSMLMTCDWEKKNRRGHRAVKRPGGIKDRVRSRKNSVGKRGRSIGLTFLSALLLILKEVFSERGEGKTCLAHKLKEKRETNRVKYSCAGLSSNPWALTHKIQGLQRGKPPSEKTREKRKEKGKPNRAARCHRGSAA